MVITRGLLATSLVVLAAYGCERENPYKLTGDTTAHEDCPPVTVDPTTGPTSGAGAGSSVSSTNSTGAGAGMPDPTELDERVVDYGEALRIASLKLIGNLPTLSQVYQVADAPTEEEQAIIYGELVEDMLDDPRFKYRMVEYWRNVFKMYGNAVIAGEPTRETAPAFAARIVVEGRPWTDMLKASIDTCPTFDENTGEFVPGECNNNITPAGVLTDPGAQSLYWGNLAFRRNRFIHETFLCRNGNASGGAEPTNAPSTEGACGEDPPPNYTSPWPMGSISGECNADLSKPHDQVDFHEYNATTICANCHATWNHRAPLFANFDKNGMYTDTPQVLVPVEGAPFAQRTDWLPVGEPTAWKFGMPAADLAELGNVMANDPEVHACAVKRMWNYAMSRGDIVDNETPVANVVVEPFVEDFVNSNFNMRETLKAILLSEDFVSF